MDMLKKFFPDAFRSKDTNSLIVTVIIYVVIAALSGIIFGLLAKIPLVGFLFGAIGTIVGLYAALGVVLAFLVFFKVIQD